MTFVRKGSSQHCCREAALLPQSDFCAEKWCLSCSCRAPAVEEGWPLKPTVDDTAGRRRKKRSRLTLHQQISDYLSANFDLRSQISHQGVLEAVFVKFGTFLVWYPESILWLEFLFTLVINSHNLQKKCIAIYWVLRLIINFGCQLWPHIKKLNHFYSYMCNIYMYVYVCTCMCVYA